MSTSPALLIVGGGSDESVEVGAGRDEPSTADVVGVGGGFVVTVVRGGWTEGTVAVAGLDVVVDVDRTVGRLVTVVSTGVSDDADVGADESPPSLHPPTATASSATSTTLDRGIIRSIMSAWANKVPADARQWSEVGDLEFHHPHVLCSTSMGQDHNEKT